MNNKSRLLILTLIITAAVILAGCGGKNDDQSRSSDLPEDVESLIILAKFDLSLKTGVDVEAIKTVDTEEIVFSDSNMGVPQPGVPYDNIATPGYIIILDADGEEYEYRASGEKVIQVPKP
jgi:hypothetical protein